MAECVTFDENGILRSTSSSIDECTGYVLVSPTEYTTAIQSMEIDPLTVVSIFSGSFAAVVVLSVAAFKVQVTKRLIKLG